jgi:hypothetical protein
LIKGFDPGRDGGAGIGVAVDVTGGPERLVGSRLAV